MDKELPGSEALASKTIHSFIVFAAKLVPFLENSVFCADICLHRVILRLTCWLVGSKSLVWMSPCLNLT